MSCSKCITTPNFEHSWSRSPIRSRQHEPNATVPTDRHQPLCLYYHLNIFTYLTIIASVTLAEHVFQNEGGKTTIDSPSLIFIFSFILSIFSLYFLFLYFSSCQFRGRRIRHKPSHTYVGLRYAYQGAMPLTQHISWRSTPTSHNCLPAKYVNCRTRPLSGPVYPTRRNGQSVARPCPTRALTRSSLSTQTPPSHQVFQGYDHRP